MTPREYLNACDGYSAKADRQYKTGWGQARWVASVIVNVNSPKKQYKPEDILKFPWEKGGDHAAEIEKLKEMRKWREQ